MNIDRNIYFSSILRIFFVHKDLRSWWSNMYLCWYWVGEKVLLQVGT